MKKKPFGILLAVYLFLAGLLLLAGDINLFGLPIVRYVTGALAIAAAVIFFVSKE